MTIRQNLAAQRQAFLELGVVEDRIYTDRGLTGTTRARPGLDQALAAGREGDTLVVPKLDRLARSVPDARAIADRLRKRSVKLALGRALYDPDDPMGKMFFNVLPTFAEFETDLIRTRQGVIAQQAARTLPHACHRRVFHQRSRRALLRLKTNCLSHTQPAPFPLAYYPAPYRNRPLKCVLWPHFRGFKVRWVVRRFEKCSQNSPSHACVDPKTALVDRHRTSKESSKKGMIRKPLKSRAVHIFFGGQTHGNGTGAAN